MGPETYGMPTVLQGNRALGKGPHVPLICAQKSKEQPRFAQCSCPCSSQFSSLLVPQVQRDSAHLIIMQALRTGQMIPHHTSAHHNLSKNPFDRLFRQQQNKRGTHCQIIWFQIKDFINSISEALRDLWKRHYFAFLSFLVLGLEPTTKLLWYLKTDFSLLMGL